MLKELIKLSNHLDSKGLQKESDYLDKIILKVSSSKLSTSEEISFLEDRDFEGSPYRISYGKATRLSREVEPGMSLYPQIEESVKSMVMNSEGYSYVGKDEYFNSDDKLNKIYLDVILKVENEFTPEDNYVICLVGTNHKGMELFYYKRFRDMSGIKDFNPEEVFEEFNYETGKMQSELYNAKNMLEEMVSSNKEQMNGYTRQELEEEISRLESELDQAGASSMKRQPGYSVSNF